MADLVRLELPCTRAEADAATARDDLPGGLLALAADLGAKGWRLVGWAEPPPAPALLVAFAALAPSSRQAPRVLEEEGQDWLRLSQAGLAPVEAGRFHLHDTAHAGLARPGRIAIRIDAGLAFGTGHHATTSGCLAQLAALARHRAPRRILDVGTGTGVLAIAAARLWRRAEVRAGDVDARAARIAATNARLNRLGRHRLRPVMAAGLLHPALLLGAPYDLAMANILAGPLIGLAPTLAPAIAPGGLLMLAGLLAHQRPALVAAFQARGFRLVARGRGEWPVLLLARRGPGPRRSGKAGRGPGPLVRAARRGTAGRTRRPDEA
jgi:ribosomal protein L11 methyltransferase